MRLTYIKIIIKLIMYISNICSNIKINTITLISPLILKNMALLIMDRGDGLTIVYGDLEKLITKSKYQSKLKLNKIITKNILNNRPSNILDN